MTQEIDYATAAQLKDSLRITDTADDAMLGYAITAASRAIDQHCGRTFGLVASVEARYYEPRWDRRRSRFTLAIDDLMTSTGLLVDVDPGGDGTFEQSLALDTDVRLHPYNAPQKLRPWTRLVADWSTVFVPGVSSFFDRAVRVTAKWGWTTPPAVVTQATLIQASRFFSRRNSPYGIAGSPEMGSELRLLARLDPDVEQLLHSVSRNWGVY
jgi:gp6-like head-tail connector protein